MSGFSCDEAPAIFGHPAARVDDCLELLPGVWRVVLASDALPGGADVFRGIWLDGRRMDDRGLAALSRWARGVKLYEVRTIDAWALGQALEVLAAFPAGFDAESVASVVDPDTGKPGGVVARDPLTVVAHRAGYVPPGWAADGGDDGGDGDAEPSWGRATLRGTPDYGFSWTVEHRPPHGAWQRVELP